MYKAAILGTGIIARKMAYTLNEMEGVCLYAVASRTLDKAQDFAKEFGAEKAYGSYEEMAADQEIDLVYIATPHSLHAENALMCLEHGRNVLVEKPFSLTFSLLFKTQYLLCQIAIRRSCFFLSASDQCRN